jgi:hypothetical protein
MNRDAAVNANLIDSRELTVQYLIWNLLPCQRLLSQWHGLQGHSWAADFNISSLFANAA